MHAMCVAYWDVDQQPHTHTHMHTAPVVSDVQQQGSLQCCQTEQGDAEMKTHARARTHTHTHTQPHMQSAMCSNCGASSALHTVAPLQFPPPGSVSWNEDGETQTQSRIHITHTYGTHLHTPVISNVQQQRCLQRCQAEQTKAEQVVFKGA